MDDYKDLFTTLDGHYHVVKKNKEDKPLLTLENLQYYPGPSFQTVVVRYEYPQPEDSPYTVFFDAEYKVSLN